jgi:S1-C subfamily serine protease
MKRAILPVLLALAACREHGTVPAFVETLEAQRPTRPAITRQVDDSRRTALVEASSRVSPSVVSIAVTTTRQASQSPFDFFFVPQSPRSSQSFGTGFIIRSNGIVVTNQHVVSGADRIIVTLSDGTDLPAELLGEDPLTDIAVIRIERTGSRSRRWNQQRPHDWEWLVAMGNPLPTSSEMPSPP